MTGREKAEIWRSRIEYLQEKRKAFFEGEGEPLGEGTVCRPGANFAIEAYRGNTKPDWWDPSDPWVNINKVKSAIRAALPSLLYSNPKFRVAPSVKDIVVGPDGQIDISYERAMAKQMWLNHVWTQAQGITHTRNAIQNAFCSYGVVKAGYRYQLQDDDKRGVFAKDEETGEYILDANGDPELERGEYLTDEEGELIRDSDGIPVPHPGTITKEEWFVETVDPRMMLFDVESGPDFFQHRFVIEEWVRPLDQVKRDPRFSRSLRDRLRATESIHGPATQRKSLFEDLTSNGDTVLAVQNDEARVRGYDIYDFENDEYLVLTESALEYGPVRDSKGRFSKKAGKEASNDEFLLETSTPPGMEHGPYRFCKLTEDMGTEWYPIPDAIDMALVNREYNITRSQMMIHREHTKTRFLEMPGAYEGHEGVDAEEERAKWAHGPDGTSVRVSGPNAIAPAPKPQIDGSFMQAVPNIQYDFNEVSGMPGESRGVADADTATQASILATGNEIRNNDRRDNIVAKFLCEIGRMLLMSGQANAELDSLLVVRVTDQVGVQPFKAVKVTPAELRGEFEVEVEVGSTLPKNDPRMLQQLTTLLGALAQNPGIGLYKGLIRRQLDAMNMDSALADEVQEVSERLVQMQMQGPTGNNGGGDPAAPAGDAGQIIQNLLTGGTGNAAGGAPTGAGLN